jgi:hypothetical protein
MESSTESLDFPLMVINDITGREERRTPADKSYKAKLECLRSARLIHRDPKATKLDMQMLQM